MSLYLSKKKKAELQSHAKELGLEYNNKLKNELEQDIAEELHKHEKQYRNDPAWAAYFDSLGESSPVKSTAVTRRRQSRHFSKSTATDEESPEPAVTSPVSTRKKSVARTPRASALRMAPSLPLTPGDLADAMNSRTLERVSNKVKDTTTQLVEQMGAKEKIAYTRETLSQVNTLSAIAIFYEFVLLMRDLIPIDYYQMDVPVPGVGNSSHILNIPNLFVLLSYADFWKPLLFWALNALVIPLTVAYFVNLRQTSRYDPLSYAVTRGLVTYFVYDKQILKYSKIPFFTDDTGPLVNSVIGVEAPFIASAVTGLAAIWDAIVNRA